MFLNNNFHINLAIHLQNLKLLITFFPCIIDSILFNHRTGNFFLNLNSFFLFNLKIQNEFLFFFIFLNKSSLYRFKSCTDITSIDYISKFNRFKLIYILSSIVYNNKVNITVFTDQNISPHSISFIFLSACWLEREVYDMFGIYFLNHKCLQRILTDYGFFDYPLLKTFPCSGFTEIFFSLQSKRLKFFSS